MKVIDLLNKIANGEEVPKKINYDGLIYIFDIAENNYISEKADYYDGDYITHKYLTESFEFDILNNEIEIIEEEKEIEKLSWQQIVYKEIKGVLEGTRDIKDIVIDINNQIDKIGNKINELVKELNKIKKEGK